MVTAAGLTVPANTVEYKIDKAKVVEFMSNDTSIYPGYAVSFDASVTTEIVATTSNVDPKCIGIALNNRLYDETNQKQYDWDDAFPARVMVPVALLHDGHIVVAKSKGAVTAGADVVPTTTAGKVVDGTVAGTVIGRALSAATDGDFLLNL